MLIRLLLIDLKALGLDHVDLTSKSFLSMYSES